jgi:endonuclease/exonuclease/phosphatase family metal-dependent hydrolase
MKNTIKTWFETNESFGRLCPILSANVTRRIALGFAVIICFTALLFACKDDDNNNDPVKEDPYFEIDAQFTTQTFGPEGDTVNIDVNTNQTVTVSSSAAWCVAELITTPTINLSLKVERLTSAETRTATVTIACTGFDNVVIYITQTGASASLSITPLELETVATKGGDVTFTVTANTEWNYNIVETNDWLTEKSKNDTELVLTISENNTKSSRSSTINIYLTQYPDLKEEITISQDPTWDTTLNVMTFNIRDASEKDGENSWTYRYVVVTKVIVDNDMDIIGTQEVNVSQHYYLTTTSKLKNYRSVGEPGENGGGYDLLFFKKDRFILLDEGTFWLSETPDVAGSKSWGSGYVRMATWAKLKDKATGKELFAINTHIDHTSASAQVGQVATLLQKIEELHGDLPVILTGDFNMSRDNANIIAITTASFSHTLDVAETKSGKDYTYHGFSETPLPGSYFADYIFTSSDDIRVYEHKVFPEKLDGIYLSDHTPVTAKIAIK